MNYSRMTIAAFQISEFNVLPVGYLQVSRYGDLPVLRVALKTVLIGWPDHQIWLDLFGSEKVGVDHGQDGNLVSKQMKSARGYMALDALRLGMGGLGPGPIIGLHKVACAAKLGS
jgi:hypothetical protein